MGKNFIILRGPAGIGKTTIGKKLAKASDALYISVDKILKDNKLNYVPGEPCVPEANCIKVNGIILSTIKKYKEDKPIVIEGCFYHLSQIRDLIEKLPKEPYVFTLKAKIPILVKRDKTRRGIGKKSIKAVHKLVSRFDYGHTIDTNQKGVDEIIKEIISYYK